MHCTWELSTEKNECPQIDDGTASIIMIHVKVNWIYWLWNRGKVECRCGSNKRWIIASFIKLLVFGWYNWRMENHKTSEVNCSRSSWVSQLFFQLQFLDQTLIHLKYCKKIKFSSNDTFWYQWCLQFDTLSSFSSWIYENHHFRTISTLESQ